MLLRIKGFLAQMWTETIQERGGQVDREYSSACTHFLTDIDTGLDCTKAKKDGKVSVEITCNGPPSYACANEHRCNAPPHIRHSPVGRSRDRRSVLYRFMLNCVRIAFPNHISTGAGNTVLAQRRSRPERAVRPNVGQ